MTSTSVRVFQTQAGALREEHMSYTEEDREFKLS